MNKIIVGLFLLISVISCAQTVDSNELFKNETVLKLNIHQSDTVLIDNSIDLEINSPKIKELQNWIDNNKTDWKNSIASFAQPSISVIGKDFRLLIFKDFVVIGYTDKNNKQRQITKQIDSREFEFLIDKKQ
mgnify:FL=1